MRAITLELVCRRFHGCGGHSCQRSNSVKNICQYSEPTATGGSLRALAVDPPPGRLRTQARSEQLVPEREPLAVFKTTAGDRPQRRAPGDARAWLADETGRRYFIHELTRLGRSRENDRVLPDQNVSRRHAVITRDDSGACWLLDLNSTNGTFLNQARVEQNSLLRTDDHIRIGPFELVFQQPGRLSAGSCPTTLIGCESYHRENRWLLLVDIEHATEFLVKNGTESYQARVDHWLASAQRIVDRHFGSIHQYLGDGFFACWPDTVGIESEVVKALHSLRAEELKSPFAFRLVLHFAEVLVAGRGSKHKAGLCGEAVHYIFRLEKVASRLAYRELYSTEAVDLLGSLLPAMTQVECEVPDFGLQSVFTSTSPIAGSPSLGLGAPPERSGES